MSIWSVDGKTAYNEPPRRGTKETGFCRLVHYVPSDMAPVGVRYLDLLPSQFETLEFGQTLDLSGVRGGRVSPDSFIEMQRAGHDSPVREKLDSEIRAMLGQARQQGDDIEIARDDLFELSPSSPLDEEVPMGNPNTGGSLRVYVHNVGQGDTIVVESPAGLWLIDARLYGKRKRAAFDQWLRKRFPDRPNPLFDAVFMSHLHYDHVHSMEHAISTYGAKAVYVAGSLLHPTASVRNAFSAAGNNLVSVSKEFSIRADTFNARIVPTSTLTTSLTSDPNDHELVLLLRTKRTHAFLSGDTPGHLCKQLAPYPSSVVIWDEESCPGGQPRPPVGHFGRTTGSLYKVSHHGSRTGTDGWFPSTAHYPLSVISCGYHRRFKHPHVELTTRLPNAEITRNYARDAVLVYSLA
jgi:beta-lactamase superfamily II metal-dependent hydrolase